MQAPPELQGAIRLSDFTDVDAAGADAFIRYLGFAFENRRPKEPAYAAQGISPGMQVLDAGCGIGDDVRGIAAAIGPSGRVVGLDASEAMIEEARRRGLPANASVVCGSVYALPFEDGSFGAIRAERLFQHLERPDSAAAELYRVLAPGGSLLVVDQDWETMAIEGGDRDVTRRVVRGFVDSLANGWAGRRLSGLLFRAGFRGPVVVGGVNSLPFAVAYVLALAPAIAAACASGAISREEGEAWLRSLMEADRAGSFYYGVSVFAGVGRKEAAVT